MRITTPYPAVESPALPAGVRLQPRKPEDARFEEVPRDWFGYDLVLSSASNLFSFIIPAHERFFIRTVQTYLKRIEDENERELVRAFIKQEAFHYATHEAFNRTRAQHGMNVERDLGLIDRTFAWIERRVPLKWRLGMTAFMEHCTALAAHVALGPHSDLPYQHPTMQALWRWHAVEEIEHKAVAFDLFEKAGGGYFLRVFSALLTIVIDGLLIRKLVRYARQDARARGEDSRQPLRALTEKQQTIRRDAWRAVRLGNRDALRLAAMYFRPGFHPWQVDDRAYLADSYRMYAALPSESLLSPAEG
jgi:predicted metal-dependent hydrolase